MSTVFAVPAGCACPRFLMWRWLTNLYKIVLHINNSYFSNLTKKIYNFGGSYENIYEIKENE